MGEINSAQYSSVFPRFLLSLGFHPLGEDAKSCESPWLLVETAFFTPLSVDLGNQYCPRLSRCLPAVETRRCAGSAWRRVELQPSALALSPPPLGQAPFPCTRVPHVAGK